MELKLGQKYKFKSTDRILSIIRGMYFTVADIQESYTLIKITDQNGNIIRSPSNSDLWACIKYNDVVWEPLIDVTFNGKAWGTSKLEFKFI